LRVPRRFSASRGSIARGKAPDAGRRRTWRRTAVVPDRFWAPAVADEKPGAGEGVAASPLWVRRPPAPATGFAPGVRKLTLVCRLATFRRLHVLRGGRDGPR
jgi:hypothetical protein